MYYIYFSFGIIELFAILILNYKIFKILMTTLVQTFNLFKLNLKIWLVLSLLATILHLIFVFPESEDRYGLLDLIPQGDKFEWLLLNLIADIITISFSLYFVCYLRFHVIYPNLDNRNEIFYSMFAILHENYWPDKIIPKPKNDEKTEDLFFNELLDESEFILPVDDRKNYISLINKENDQSNKENKKVITKNFCIESFRDDISNLKYIIRFLFIFTLNVLSVLQYVIDGIAQCCALRPQCPITKLLSSHRN